MPVAVTLPAGVTAYTGAVHTTSATTAVLTLTPITGDVIPAGTAVLLSDANQNAKVTLTKATDQNVEFTGNNVLVGYSVDYPIAAHTDYIFGTGSKGAGFYKSGATTLPAHRAFLPGSAVSSAISTLSIEIGDVVNGISTIKSGDELQRVYDLQGREVQNPQKGIYIRGGKKVYIGK